MITLMKLLEAKIEHLKRSVKYFAVYLPNEYEF